MFGISTSELLIILGVGLVVLGPQKLPEVAKALGRAIGEFKRATSDIKESFEADENLAEAKRTFDEAVAEGMRAGLKEETAEEALSSDVLQRMKYGDMDESAAWDEEETAEEALDQPLDPADQTEEAAPPQTEPDTEAEPEADTAEKTDKEAEAQ